MAAILAAMTKDCVFEASAGPDVCGRWLARPGEVARTFAEVFETGAQWRDARTYIPAKGGMGRNSVAHESPEIDRLLDAGVRDIDREKRKRPYFCLPEV